MRHFVSPLLIAVTALLVGGCKDDHESLMKKGIEQMASLGAVLKTVQDEKSSKAAAPKVESIIAGMQDLKKKADAMPKPTDDQDKQLRSKYEKEMEEALKSFMQEAMRIATNEKLMTPELKAAMDKMNNMR